MHGIPVNQKADALFFLQTARIDQRRNRRRDQARTSKFEMARYVVHYADGQTANIPLYSEIDVDDYRQKTPTPLPGAQIAWTHKYEGTEFVGRRLLEAVEQPAPERRHPERRSGLRPRPARRPVLLALTAATSH